MTSRLAKLYFSKDPLSFQYLSDRLRDNEEMALSAIQGSLIMAALVSDRLKKNIRFVQRAIQQKPDAFYTFINHLYTHIEVDKSLILTPQNKEVYLVYLVAYLQLLVLILKRTSLPILGKSVLPFCVHDKHRLKLLLDTLNKQIQDPAENKDVRKYLKDRLKGEKVLKRSALIDDSEISQYFRDIPS